MLQIVPWSIPIPSTIKFYLSVFAAFFGIFFPQTYFFLNENPFIWLFNCILKESHRVSEYLIRIKTKNVNIDISLNVFRLIY